MSVVIKHPNYTAPSTKGTALYQDLSTPFLCPLEIYLGMVESLRRFARHLAARPLCRYMVEGTIIAAKIPTTMRHKIHFFMVHRPKMKRKWTHGTEVVL